MRLAAILLALPAMAWAATAYLTEQWVSKGDNYCKYSNGTVLNMGYKACPASIKL